MAHSFRSHLSHRAIPQALALIGRCGLGVAIFSLAPVFAHAAASCSAPQLDALSGVVNLPPDCVFNEEAKIVASNTQLNCNGSVFDGRGQLAIGLMLDAERQKLEHIQIKNCVFRNYTSHGIRITLRGHKSGREDNYARAPKDIEIASSQVENTGHVGIYLDEYVTRVTIKDSTVRNSGSTAIYLDQATRDNVIVGNHFIGNGIDKDGRARREALAIDSSANNLIQGNTFEKNGRGGIFLYKNCGEKFSTGRSTLRWQHSDHNRIMENRFLDEAIGVWVASRQSTNLQSWDCGDAPMDKSKYYYEDFANNNVINNNQFCNTRTAVRVEGDDNQVRNNRYDANVKKMIDIPLSKRGELLGRPASGNVVENNEKKNCTGTVGKRAGKYEK